MNPEAAGVAGEVPADVAGTGGAPADVAGTGDALDHMPVGYLAVSPDGVIVEVNRTLLEWTGHRRADLIGRRRFVDLLSPAGRIFHDTHIVPLLHVEGAVREVALDLLRADGTRQAALVGAVLARDAAGEPALVRITLTDATERKRYERELLAARRRAEQSEARVRVLQDVVARFAAAVTVDDVADVLVDAAVDAFGAVGSGLWVEAPGGGDLVRVASTRAFHPVGPARIAAGAPLPHARAVATGEVVIVVADDAAPVAEALHQAGARRLAAVPVVCDGRVTGVVSFAFAEDAPLPDDELALMRTLGRQAGQALERARLFEVEQRQRRRAEALHAIAAAVNGARGAARVAAVVVDELVLRGIASGAALTDPGDVPEATADPGSDDGPPPAGEVLAHRQAEGHGAAPVPSAALVAAWRRAAGERPAGPGPLGADDGPGEGAADGVVAVVDAGGVDVAATVDAGDGRALVLWLRLPGATRLGPGSRAFVQSVAYSTGQAVERARLHDETVRAARRAQQLARAGRILDDAPGLGERARHLADLLVESGAQAARVVLPDGDGADPVVAVAQRPPADDGADPPAAPARDALAEQGRAALARALETGARQVVPVSGPAGRRAGDRAVAAVAVPLRRRRRVLGAALAEAPPGDPFGPGDLAFLDQLADQAAPALENAHLYERQRAIALTLQRSLLSVEPPADRRFSVASTYRPAVEGLEVGGDWFDAFMVGDGRLALVVGDVVGKGIDAASTMGQLRSAVRALAVGGGGPARVLEQLDDFVERFEPARMTTVVYGELEFATGRLRVARAGHPPPVLVEPDGGARLLWEGLSTPLGALSVAAPRSEAEVVLPVGSRLVLFTDGLFERPGEVADRGLERVLRAVERHRRRPLAGAVDAVVADAAGQAVRDDICVLAASVGHPPVFERVIDAEAGQLLALRADLRGWLDGHGVGPDDVHALVLACGEAAANAVRHGEAVAAVAAAPPAAVRVVARCDAAEVVLDVINEGTAWGVRQEGDAGGRGLDLMGRLMDEVVVDVGEHTAVRMRRRRDEGGLGR